MADMAADMFKTKCKKTIFFNNLPSARYVVYIVFNNNDLTFSSSASKSALFYTKSEPLLSTGRLRQVPACALISLCTE